MDEYFMSNSPKHMVEAKKRKKILFSSVSIPTSLMEEIEKVVEELQYWPTKAAFVREACLEKLEKYRRELEARKDVEAPKIRKIK